MPTIKFRRGTAAEWTSENPILAEGELGYETDTGKYKIGNGTHYWSTRPYYPTDTEMDVKLDEHEIATNPHPQYLQNAAAKATVGNLLTDNQASGTDASADTSGFSVDIGATLASSTAEAHTQSRSLAVTLTTTGPSVATSVMGGVISGEVFTASAWVKGPANLSLGLTVQFFTAASGFLSATSAPMANLTSSWTKRTVTVSAPATAAKFRLVWAPSGGNIADVFYVDTIGAWRGAGGEWAMPGVPITGLGTRITRPNIDDRLVEVWNGSAWSIVEYDSGVRNISSLIDADFKLSDVVGLARVRRNGQRVTIWGRLQRNTGSGDMSNPGIGTMLSSIPSGFQGEAAYSTAGVARVGAAVGLVGFMGSPTELCVVLPAGGTWVADTYIDFECSFTTPAVPPPTSLPGTLVSAAFA